jgi:hypothetical protein
LPAKNHPPLTPIENLEVLWDMMEHTSLQQKRVDPIIPKHNFFSAPTYTINVAHNLPCVSCSACQSNNGNHMPPPRPSPALPTVGVKACIESGSVNTKNAMERELKRVARGVVRPRGGADWGSREGKTQQTPIIPTQLMSSGAKTMVKPPNPLATLSAEPP